MGTGTGRETDVLQRSSANPEQTTRCQETHDNEEHINATIQFSLSSARGTATIGSSGKAGRSRTCLGACGAETNSSQTRRLSGHIQGTIPGFNVLRRMYKAWFAVPRAPSTVFLQAAGPPAFPAVRWRLACRRAAASTSGSGVGDGNEPERCFNDSLIIGFCTGRRSDG